MKEFSCSHVRDGSAPIATVVATVTAPESVWHSASNDPLEVQRERVDCRVQLCLLCIAHARYTLEGYASDLPPALVKAWAHDALKEPSLDDGRRTTYVSVDPNALISMARVYQGTADRVRLWTSAGRYAGELNLEAGRGHTLATWLGLQRQPSRNSECPICKGPCQSVDGHQ